MQIYILSCMSDKSHFARWISVTAHCLHYLSSWSQANCQHDHHNHTHATSSMARCVMSMVLCLSTIDGNPYLNVLNVSGTMQRTPSEVSEAYSDVFEEDIPQQSAEDNASETASIKSVLTVSQNLEGSSDQDADRHQTYMQGNSSKKFQTCFL